MIGRGWLLVEKKRERKALCEEREKHFCEGKNKAILSRLGGVEQSGGVVNANPG